MEVRSVEDTAELITNTTIPTTLLTRRVNHEPLSNEIPKVKMFPMDEISKYTLQNMPQVDSIRLQESLVVRDLLDNLLGLGGTYIRYNNSFDPYLGDIPEFKVVKKMDSSLKSFSKRILQYGSYYVSLIQAVEKWSDVRYGIVLQRLSYEINKFLHESYMSLLVNRLEREYKENVNFSIRDLKQIIEESQVGPQMKILYQLVDKIEQEMKLRQTTDLQQISMNKFMSEMNEINDHDDMWPMLIERNISMLARGGNIINILTRMIQENLGDTNSVIFMETLLNNISEDYMSMLHQWLVQGELNDKYQEFMIINTMQNVKSNNMLNPIECDRIWLTQYGIRQDGLFDIFQREYTLNGNNEMTDHSERFEVRANDQLQNHSNNGNDLLFKILTTGKLLNLIKKSLQITHIPVANEYLNVINYGNNNNSNNNGELKFVDIMKGTRFEIYVNNWYKRANDLILNILNNEFSLNDTIQNMHKWFFSMNNNHQTNQIMRTNLHELSQKYDPDSREFIQNRLLQNLQDFKKCILEKSTEYENEDVDEYSGSITNRNIKFDMIIKLLVVQMDNKSFEKTIFDYIKSENSTIQNNEPHNFSNFESLRDIVMQEFEQAIGNKNGDEIISGDNNNNHNTITSRKNENNINYIKFDVGIPYPLNVIINRTCLTQYQLISRYLQILQYYNNVMDETWLEINKSKIWKYQGFSQDIKVHIIRRSRIVHNSMNNLVKSLMEYFMNDVVQFEISRIEQMIKYSSEQGDFNHVDVIGLQSIISESLTNILHDTSIMSLIDIQLKIFDLIDKFTQFLMTMRRRFCKIDYNLFNKYRYRDVENGTSNSKRRNLVPGILNASDVYNEDENVAKIPEYIQFITKVDETFHDLKKQLLNGMKHSHGKDNANNGNFQGITDTIHRSNTILVQHGDRLTSSNM